MKRVGETEEEGWDEEDANIAKEGYCIECEGPPSIHFLRLSSQKSPALHLDQPAEVRCEACADIYCEVCFAAQHRKGSRKQHKQKQLEGAEARLAKKASRNAKKASAAAEDTPNVRVTRGGQSCYSYTYRLKL